MQDNNREEKFERKRLEQVFSEIHKQKKQLLEKSERLKQSVVHLRRDFWDDVTVNIDNVDEMIETQASIRQQAEVLSERERSHGQLYKQLRNLEQLEDSPYFGRIDFEEEGEEVDEIYIGKASLMDEEGHEFLVYDWRAPIASMYYDFTPGPAYFETMDGTIHGRISLKRQFIIERGKLIGMFDTGLTIGDHLLQRALGSRASTKMKSIVSTIQREQNKVIRNEQKKFLVVQGAAGSGKTSAALQRVAYLLYRHRDLLHAKNMMLFSPNPLFSSYIANVLPDLGEENIQQMTFFQFIDRNIKELKVQSPFEQMEYVLTQQDDDEYSLRKENIFIKSNIVYKQIIDEYLESLHKNGIIFKPIMFRDEVLISREEMENYFASLKAELPLKNKMRQLSTWLLQRINQLRETEKNKDWVREALELLDEEILEEAYQNLQEEEVMEEFYDSGQEELYLQQKVINTAIEPLIELVDRYEYIDFVRTYAGLFSNWQPKTKLPESWEEMCVMTKWDLAKGWLSWEEATAFSYFIDMLIGDSANRRLRHIIIDEAQDYTPFQIAYLKQIYPYTNFTLLGDMNQAIYEQTRKGNPLQTLIGEDVERLSLTRSYRSTKEIIEFSKQFAPTKEKIKPFERRGRKPRVMKTSNKDHVETIEHILREYKEKDYGTIGIVCKTMEETKILANKLSGRLDFHKITETSKEYSAGVSILPIYLAKGIEFDAVIIPEASSETYKEEDQALFYTACTRAMHDLTMITLSDVCSFIEKADENTYEKMGVFLV